MRIAFHFLLLGLLAATLGCGNGNTGLNTAPLTDEQKRQIAEDDKRIQEEESNNSSVKVKGKK